MKIPTPTFLHAGRVKPDAAWHMDPHDHPFYELIVPMRGSLRVATAADTQVAGPGDILLYPPGVVHEEWAEAAAFESLFVAFRAEGLPCDRVAYATDADGRIRDLMRWLHRDQHALRIGEDASAQLHLALIVELFRQSRAATESEWVQGLRAWIRRQIATPITLERLACHAGMSRYHFSRKYHQLAGRPPMSDVRRIRADFARDLILTTNMPLKEIAPAAGLANEYTLSRLFRQLFDMPPGEFRRRHRPPSPAVGGHAQGGKHHPEENVAVCPGMENTLPKTFDFI